MMAHNRWLMWTLTALALAALLAGCVVPTTAPGGAASGSNVPTRESTGGVLETLGPDDAVRQDAKAYAGQYGVSVDEAIERLQFQDGIGDLNAALQANEADTFGGLWIEHEPDFRVVVLFTRNGKRTIRPYLAGKPYAHLVEVRKARYALAELEAIRAQAMGELAKLDFGVNVLLDVPGNRVEVPVSDPGWFESELRHAEVQLPDGVEVVVVEGGATARNVDLLLTPPVPGIAFPRQKPVEGFRAAMAAALTGTLRLEEGCLRVDSLHGDGSLLPIWPPGYTLRAEGEQVLVIDGEGQAVARAGEEVYMGGGSVPVTDEWVLQQIPPACRGEYWVVGTGVRPNLNLDSDLFALDVVSDTARTVLFLRYRPALDERVTEVASISGKLVAYDTNRCLHLQTEWGPGSVALLWPPNWSLVVGDGAFVLQDEAGRRVATVGDEVRLRGRAIPHDADVATYRQLIDELPGDCVGLTWLVEKIE
jgi:hypothetical protein